MQDAIQRICSCGHKVNVIDITQFTYPRVSIRVSDVRGEFEGLGEEVSFVYLANNAHFSNTKDLSFGTWIDEAIESELATKYRGKLPGFLSFLVGSERKVIRKLTAMLVLELRKLHNMSGVWVYPNGRFSSQRAILEVANDFGFDSSCYERSRFESRYYFRDYRVHDRISLNKDYVNFDPKELTTESRQAVTLWLADRQSPNSKNNSFSANFLEEIASISLLAHEKLASFYSSSRDELEGLGADWSTFEWRDQYEAFLEIGKLLSSRGYKLVLRVHPNLLNKSPHEIRIELRKIEILKNAGFQILGPGSNTSSYKLVKMSNLVIVARSTIGIEAMCAGRPVLLTANAFYDQLPELTLVASKREVERVPETFCSASTISASAQNWLAFNYQRDYPYTKSELVLRPKIIRRVAGMLRKDVQLYYLYEGAARFFSLTSRWGLEKELSNYS
jgi:hypothetical protein